MPIFGDKDDLGRLKYKQPVEEEPVPETPIVQQLKSIDRGIEEQRIDGDAFLSSDTPEATAYMTFKQKGLGKQIAKGIDEGRIDRDSLIKNDPSASVNLFLAEHETKNPGAFNRIIDMQNTLRKVHMNTESEDDNDFLAFTENDISNLEAMQSHVDTLNDVLEKQRGKGIKISTFGDLMGVVSDALTVEETRKAELFKRASFKSKTGKELTDEEIEALAFSKSGAIERIPFASPSDPLFGLPEGILAFGAFNPATSKLGILAAETGLGAAFPFIDRAQQILDGEKPDKITLNEVLFSAGIGGVVGLARVGAPLAASLVKKGIGKLGGELNIPNPFKSPVSNKNFGIATPAEQVSSPAIPNVSRETSGVRDIDFPEVPTTPEMAAIAKTRSPSAPIDNLIQAETTAVDVSPDNPLSYFPEYAASNDAIVKKTAQKGFIPVQSGGVFRKFLTEERGAVGGDIPPNKPIRAKITPETQIQPRSEVGIPEAPTLAERLGTGQSARQTSTIAPGASSYLDVLDSSRETKAAARKVTFKRLRESFKRNFVDVAGNVKKELRQRGYLGEDAARRLELALGANERAIRRIDDMYGAVYEGLSREEKLTLDEFIMTRTRLDSTLRRRTLRQSRLAAVDFLPQELRESALREVAADPLLQELKNPGGATAEDLAEVIAKAYPDEMKPMLEQRSDAFFATMRNQLDELLDEGIISADLHEKLYGNNYARTEFFDYIDPDMPSTGPGVSSKVNVTTSGIKKLKGGAEGELDLDTDEIAMQLITRNQKIIMKNRANRSLYELGLSEMQSGTVNPIITLPVNIDDELLQVAQPRPGYTILSTYLKGKKHDMYMPDELAREWIERDPMLSQRGAEWAQWLTGTKVLKMGATGVNPEFAFTNFPRDQSLVFLTTNEHSSFLPMYFAQMGRDLIETFPDALTGKGLYQDYIEAGGGMDFLAQQAFNRAPMTRGGTLSTLKDIAAYLGTVSERWTRLALTKRALKNGKTMDEAAHIGRSYLDFSQGGHVAKGLDNFIPYLNANIRATASAATAARRNPKLFAWKMGQLMSAGFGLSAALYTKYKDFTDKIDPVTRSRNWLFPMPWTYTDPDGNKRYRYLAIPKDSTAIFFTGVADMFARRIFNDEIPDDTTLDMLRRSWEDLEQPVKQSFSIFDLSSVAPPTFQAAGAYVFNKDFWRNEDVWYDSNGFNNVFPWAEVYKSTSPFYRKVGEVSKDVFGEANSISPARLERAAQKIFPTNIWTSSLDMGYKGIRDAMLDDEAQLSDQVIDDEVRRIPFVRKILKTTPALSQQEIKDIEFIKKKSNTERILQNRGLDDLMYGMERGEATFDDMAEYIRAQDEQTQERLIGRAENFAALQGIPERSWWMNRASIQNPEERARNIWAVYIKETPENQDRMLEIMNRIPGFASKRFREEIKRLSGAQNGK